MIRVEPESRHSRSLTPLPTVPRVGPEERAQSRAQLSHPVFVRQGRLQRRTSLEGGHLRVHIHPCAVPDPGNDNYGRFFHTTSISTKHDKATYHPSRRLSQEIIHGVPLLGTTRKITNTSTSPPPPTTTTPLSSIPRITAPKVSPTSFPLFLGMILASNGAAGQNSHRRVDPICTICLKLLQKTHTHICAFPSLGISHSL